MSTTNWMRCAACMALAALALAATQVSAKVYFEETFPATWEDNWVKSSWKTAEGTAGKFVRSAGKYYSDPEKDAGIKTTPDARFFAMTSEFKETFDNTGKSLVLQFSAKHEQKIDCGGGYIKLVPASSADKIADFSGDTRRGGAAASPKEGKEHNKTNTTHNCTLYFLYCEVFE